MDIPVKVGRKEYRIQSDSYNVMLSEKVYDKKQKKYYWRGTKFYSNLNSAIEGLYEFKIKHSEAKTFNKLQMDLKQFKDELKGLYECES